MLKSCLVGGGVGNGLLVVVDVSGVVVAAGDDVIAAVDLAEVSGGQLAAAVLGA